MYKLGTASEPVSVEVSSILQKISTDWPISEAGSTYCLYFNTNFGPIPEDGDKLGVVAQVVRLARLKNSGVTQIRVEDHAIYVMFSSAVTRSKQAQFLVSAVRAAGLGQAAVN